MALAKRKPLESGGKSKKRQTPLTQTEKDDAKALESAWKRVKAKRDISQKEMAVIWGKTPGLVSQYIKGHTALNIEAKLWFAQYLRLAPVEIWPEFPFKWITPKNLSMEAMQVAIAFDNSDEEMRAPALTIINALPRKKL